MTSISSLSRRSLTFFLRQPSFSGVVEKAYLCQGDVFAAMDQFDAAERSYAMAVELDPSTRHSKSFKTRIAKLQAKLISPDLP